jgi:hypothetical protein
MHLIEVASVHFLLDRFEAILKENMLVSDPTEVAHKSNTSNQSIDVYNYLIKTLLTLLLITIISKSRD